MSELIQPQEPEFWVNSRDNVVRGYHEHWGEFCVVASVDKVMAYSGAPVYDHLEYFNTVQTERGQFLSKSVMFMGSTMLMQLVELGIPYAQGEMPDNSIFQAYQVYKANQAQKRLDQINADVAREMQEQADKLEQQRLQEQISEMEQEFRDD